MEATLNDFGTDITGFHGIVKGKAFVFGKDASTKERTFVVASGPGCSPFPGRRTIRGMWLSDGANDTVSSYDFEHVIDLQGKKVNRLPEAVDDTEPVQVAGETGVPGLPPIEALKKVRRKRS